MFRFLRIVRRCNLWDLFMRLVIDTQSGLPSVMEQCVRTCVGLPGHPACQLKGCGDGRSSHLAPAFGLSCEQVIRRRRRRRRRECKTNEKGGNRDGGREQQVNFGSTPPPPPPPQELLILWKKKGGREEGEEGDCKKAFKRSILFSPLPGWSPSPSHSTPLTISICHETFSGAKCNLRVRNASPSSPPPPPSLLSNCLQSRVEPFLRSNGRRRRRRRRRQSGLCCCAEAEPEMDTR